MLKVVNEMTLTNEPDGEFEVEVVGHVEPNFLICRAWHMLALYCRLMMSRVSIIAMHTED